jgi:hypothetical protein
VSNLIDKCEELWKSNLHLRSLFHTQVLLDLTEFHKINSIEYARIVNMQSTFLQGKQGYESVPFVHSETFKDLAFHSNIVSKGKVTTLMSSGTTSKSKSRINVDLETLNFQRRALVNTLKWYLGPKRRPILFVDSKKSIEKELGFSARAAAILGFSLIGSSIHFAFDENSNIDVRAIHEFTQESNKAANGIIFGFTFVVWEWLNSIEEGKFLSKVNSNVDLIHGGGWKKMENVGVSKQDFALKAKALLGLDKVINYYGTIEQTGSIFMECSRGQLHTTPYNHVLIRDFANFNPVKSEERGLIQTFSLLTSSYPGHSILTEDVGQVISYDQCNCGHKGIAFVIEGRAAEAEVKGCSDLR